MLRSQKYTLVNFRELDNETSHVILGKCGKKGVVVGQSLFTFVVAIFDETLGQSAGAVSQQIEQLVTAYEARGS